MAQRVGQQSCDRGCSNEIKELWPVIELNEPPTTIIIDDDSSADDGEPANEKSSTKGTEPSNEPIEITNEVDVRSRV